MEEFFSGFPDSELLFHRIVQQIRPIGEIRFQVTKSQIALIHIKPFAWLWIPEKYLHHKAAPLVLSISFPERDPSPRWKEIVKLTGARFMHHLEIYTADDIDSEVEAWLLKAWTSAGNLI